MNTLKIAKYRFLLEAGEQGLELPPFKSSAFRGGFGHIFKTLTCAKPGTDCTECDLQQSCPYIYVFETKPPSDSKIFKNFESVPHPYVIATPFDDKKTRYASGELLEFDLYLYGDAIVYVPFFIHSFELLGRAGIGKQRRPYSLLRVEAHDMIHNLSYCVYDGKQKKIRQRDYSMNGQVLLDRASLVDENTVTVIFETPLRMKWKGSYTSDPQFHLLIRNAIRRVTSLLYFHHGGQELQIDVSSLIRKAETVKLVENQTRWVDWDRYSARQDSKMTFGGIVGQAVYKGDLNELIPWLLAAETLRIGKQTAFSLGKLGLVFGE